MAAPSLTPGRGLAYAIVCAGIVLPGAAITRKAGAQNDESERLLTDLSRLPEAETMTLRTGESSIIKPDGEGNLLVSRRGILDLFYLGNCSWKATGLRRGFVSIRSGARQWLITVTESEKKSGLKRAFFPDWICQDGSMQCHQQTMVISGTSGNRHTYIQSYRWCSKHPPCLFDAGLSSPEKKLLIRSIHGRVPQSTVWQDHDAAHRSYEIPCLAKKSQNLPDDHFFKKDAIADTLVKTGIISIRCQQEPADRMWEIKAKIYSTSKYDSALKGFNGELDFRLAYPGTPEISTKILSRLEAMLTDKRASIIGEPQLIVKEGFKGIITSGGELALCYGSSSPPGQKKSFTRWKAYGMRFEVRVYGFQKGLVSLHYHLSFSQPAKGDRSMLSSDQIQSSILVPTGVPILAGQTTIRSDISSGEENPLFSQIPLIGPVFKNSDSANARTRLWIWIEASPLGGGALKASSASCAPACRAPTSELSKPLL